MKVKMRRELRMHIEPMLQGLYKRSLTFRERDHIHAIKLITETNDLFPVYELRILTEVYIFYYLNVA